MNCVRIGSWSLRLGICLTLALPVIAEENWNQFRGPRGDGTSDATGLPVKWSETENIKWKTPLRGRAWSSPVVWEGQVWVTTAPEDGKQRFAICLDLASGKVMHDIKVLDIEKPQFCYPRNSHASCTPVVERGRLYVHFGSQGTACLDTASGKILWTRLDLQCDHYRGAASSPIVWKNLLILTFDGFDLQYLVALDKETGETVWKTDRNFPNGDNGDAKKAFSTPALVKVNGHEELVSPAAYATAAYDPQTGKELWRILSGGMNSSCRPAIGNGMAFVGTADGGFQFFAVKLGGHGDVTSSGLAWKASKGAPRYSSPIFVEGLVYTANEQGAIACTEAATGEFVWQKRVGGLFMASPIYADGKLYFFDEDGKGVVLTPGREPKILATNSLAGGCMASPAVAPRSLLVRTKEALYRIGE